ncbi:xanthine dehydrogenase family protein molybdopterin-binding subunit [Chryseotalea sanaruensis]|uniref:Xanthine dehydrogenase family protein molybdopterin-binding subunit n=1 Tax=Chryseotalea sanaruensis TaxID=2482724 RepID=A0A401U6M9_9BACT|nr:xanthine dehydrogenase family protein molybdopterin-binding subunit [Chryseotalea sanaruensis]GCC50456.1 xanthine dehydrogenase family protein molybdopterin-binding subunit [Chryseotalea sanaruensis]
MEFFDNELSTLMPAEGRVEAIAKVTGKGKYAAEYTVPGVCYAVLVTSSIPAGTIKAIQVDKAKRATGVIDILYHQNKPVVPGFADETKIRESRVGLPVFYTDKIYFKGQPIALVVAESLEEATYAASLITADYTAEVFNVDFVKTHPSIPLKAAGKERGTVDEWSNAIHIVEAEYTIKEEVHNPMEMHATIAEWVGDNKVKLYEKTQGVNSVQRVISGLFSIPRENVEVISEFVGGGFGSGLRVWSNTLMAVMASLQVKRPVKLMLTRPQMFSLVGYRPESWQKIKLGADSSGKFSGMIHQAKHTTSVFENFNENITRIARLVYDFKNLKTESAIVPLNLGTPTWMRGPGDCTGDFAIESAIDELSYKLNEDPIALRLKNIALKNDPESGKPWSTHFIDECLEQGATKINWKNRKQTPGQVTEGDWQIGYGMAIGMWTSGRTQASASIVLDKSGTIIVRTAMTDIGTGTGTAMQNLAHESLGMPKNKIKVELGNSNLPPAPSQGGSTGLASLGGAVMDAATLLKQKLATYAAAINAQYKDAAAADILLSENGISYKQANAQFISYADLWKKVDEPTIEAEATSAPGEERQQFAFCSSAAHFCIVRVHSKTGKVKVDRMVCVADGGKIINEKPAANQVSGAAVGGIGMALMEEQQADVKFGSLLGNDLAGYHFAVNADAPIIEVSFIDKPDPNINQMGSKGLGEVGIIGCAAAIANAIYNATGKRLRNLPITPDKVLLG